MSDECYPEQKTVRILSNGILEVYEPKLLTLKNDLKEIISKQNTLYIDMSRQKHKFSENELKNLQDMIEKIKLYKDKTSKIRNQMHQIHYKTKTLKKKALAIQDYKVNESVARVQKMHFEECLIGVSAHLNSK